MSDIKFRPPVRWVHLKVHALKGLVMMGMPHMRLSSREDIRTEVGTCAIKASKRLSAGSGRNLKNCVKYVPGVSHAR